MAFTFTLGNTAEVYEGPTKIIRLQVNYLNTSGSTGGAITPATLDPRCRVIRNWSESANANTSPTAEATIVKSFDATTQGDILTLATVADVDGVVTIDCLDAGYNPA